MSEEAFAKAGQELMLAVHDMFKKPSLPAFIMLYSSIDIMASLTRPISQQDTNGDIFKAWVKKYMIADASFAWNENDIWGARCGLLHTYTVQSKASRTGIARELCLIGGNDPNFRNGLQQRIDSNSGNKLVVFISELVGSFFDGIQLFTSDVQKHTTLQETVLHHAAKLAIHELYEPSS